MNSVLDFIFDHKSELLYSSMALMGTGILFLATFISASVFDRKHGTRHDELKAVTAFFFEACSITSFLAACLIL